MTVVSPPPAPELATVEASMMTDSLGDITRASDEMIEAFIRTEIIAKGLSPKAARDLLQERLPGMVAEYEAAAASVARDLYDLQRADRGITYVVPYSTVAADPATTRRWQKLIGWGLTPAFSTDPDWETALTKIVGGAHKTVAQAHRETIALNSITDPASRGWRRIAHAGACDFCQMLAGRGGVYRHSTVDFASHDHCSCSAASEWESKDAIASTFKPSARVARMRDMDRLDGRGRVSDHRRRANEWLADVRAANR